MKQTAPRRSGEESDTTYRSLCLRRVCQKPELFHRLLQKSVCDMRWLQPGWSSNLGYLPKAEKVGLIAGRYGGNGKRRLKLGFKMFYLIR